jgi:putative lysine transport system substrate-binding protein/putative lysine transport system permease protein
MKKHSALFAVMPALALASCGTLPPALNDGILTVGLECGYAPFNWSTTTPTDTSVAIADSQFLCDGYDVRVSSYLAEALDVDLRIIKADWDGLIPSLTSGNIDAIIAGMTDTPSRRETISFSQPYFETRSVMIVLANSEYANAETVADFEGANVVAQAGTLQDDIIAGYEESDGWIQGTAYPTYPDALTALLSRSSGIDAILAEEPFALQMLGQQGNAIDLITIVDDANVPNDDFLITVSVGLRKSDTALLAGIETALTALSEATRLQWMADASAQASNL